MRTEKIVAVALGASIVASVCAFAIMLAFAWLDKEPTTADVISKMQKVEQKDEAAFSESEKGKCIIILDDMLAYE